MSSTWKIGTALLAAAMFVGCEKESTTPTTPSTTPPTPSASDMGAAAEKATDKAAEAGASAMAAVETQAKDLLAQAEKYIKENKFELADKAVTQLDALKSKLPAEWAPKIDSVKSMLDSAKKAAGALPGGNK